MDDKWVAIPVNRYTLEEAIGTFVPPPNRDRILRMIEANRERFQTAYGSVHNHQAWRGGWWDHITEGCNIIPPLHFLYHSLRPLSFSTGDAIISFFAHDIEKPWKYEWREDGKLHHTADFQSKQNDNKFRLRKLAEYDIELSPEQINAMKYAEGELTDYSNRERKMHELAAFVHMVDVTSARLWHNHPLSAGDPWQGALRIGTLPVS